MKKIVIVCFQHFKDTQESNKTRIKQKKDLIIGTNDIISLKGLKERKMKK
ncbi:MAG: hypothetical protein JSW60_05905 [Thermoplasmatales archaeon]|nr:MAG: hypothetical protein JSW60_05905 [Thermoplasmatales archaeon]